MSSALQSNILSSLPQKKYRKVVNFPIRPWRLCGEREKVEIHMDVDLHNLSRKSEIFVTYAKLNALAETTHTQMATAIIVTLKWFQKNQSPISHYV